MSMHRNYFLTHIRDVNELQIFSCTNLYILASKNHDEYNTNAAKLYFEPPRINRNQHALFRTPQIERDSWHSWKIF